MPSQLALIYSSPTCWVPSFVAREWELIGVSHHQLLLNTPSHYHKDLHHNHAIMIINTMNTFKISLSTHLALTFTVVVATPPMSVACGPFEPSPCVSHMWGSRLSIIGYTTTTTQWAVWNVNHEQLLPYHRHSTRIIEEFDKEWRVVYFACVPIWWSALGSYAYSKEDLTDLMKRLVIQ